MKYTKKTKLDLNRIFVKHLGHRMCKCHLDVYGRRYQKSYYDANVLHEIENQIKCTDTVGNHECYKSKCADTESSSNYKLHDCCEKSFKYCGKSEHCCDTTTNSSYENNPCSEVKETDDCIEEIKTNVSFCRRNIYSFGVESISNICIESSENVENNTLTMRDDRTFLYPGWASVSAGDLELSTGISVYDPPYKNAENEDDSKIGPITSLPTCGKMNCVSINIVKFPLECVDKIINNNIEIVFRLHRACCLNKSKYCYMNHTYESEYIDMVINLKERVKIQNTYLHCYNFDVCMNYNKGNFIWMEMFLREVIDEPIQPIVEEQLPALVMQPQPKEEECNECNECNECREYNEDVRSPYEIKDKIKYISVSIACDEH